MDYIIQIAAWSFLPNIGAGIIQSGLYGLGFKAREQEGIVNNFLACFERGPSTA